MKTLALLAIIFSFFNNVVASSLMSEDYMEPVYKILRGFEWQEFQREGSFLGSEDDIRDGFIHLATEKQVQRIIEKYFSDEELVYVLKFSDSNFLELLQWETSSSGSIYPHLYNRKLFIDDIESFDIVRIK